MNFRGSILLPKNAESPRELTWLEAHARAHDFAIFQFTSNKENIRNRTYLSFHRAGRNIVGPKSLPNGVIKVAHAADKKEALTKLLLFEGTFLEDHMLGEIGTYFFGHIRHYVELIDEGLLPKVCLPSKIFDAVEEFNDKVIDEYIENQSILPAMNATVAHVNLFRKMPLTALGIS